MIRISVDLEPLYRFYDLPGSEPHKPLLKHALALESAGVDGVVIETGEEYDPKRRRALKALADNLDIALTIKSAGNSQWIDALLEIKPSMAVFKLDSGSSDHPMDAITRLQVENVLIAFEIPSELEMVKKAARFKGDFIVFDCSSYMKAKSIGDQIESLNSISKSAALAARLSMGCIGSGNFNKQRLIRLLETKSVEEIFTGMPIFTDSLLKGYQGAVSSLRLLH